MFPIQSLNYLAAIHNVSGGNICTLVERIQNIRLRRNKFLKLPSSIFSLFPSLKYKSMMDVIDAKSDKFLLMNNEATRASSFHNWPHLDNSKCSVAKMAEAGFFHCSTEVEPDTVRCFVCLKEVIRWNPDDDPWQKHKSHSKECLFANIGKKQNDLTIAEFLKIESDRNVNAVKLNTAMKINQMQDEAEKVKKSVKRLL